VKYGFENFNPIYVGMDYDGLYPCGRLLQLDTKFGKRDFFFVYKYRTKGLLKLIQRRMPASVLYFMGCVYYRRRIIDVADPYFVYSHRPGYELAFGKIRRILHIHGPKLATDYGRWSKSVNFLYSLIFKSMMRKASGVIFASEEASQIWKNVARKFVVVKNASDENVFFPTGQLEARGKLGLKMDNKYVVTVTRLTVNKNLPLALRSFKRLIASIPEFKNSLRFIVVGDGPEKNHLLRLAKELDVENLVLFVGEKSAEEVSVFLNAADVFLYTSNAEAFNISVVEALMSGTPVVCVNFDDIGEIVINNVTGFVVGPTEDQIAQALKDILSIGKDNLSKNCVSSVEDYKLSAYVKKVERAILNFLQT